MDTTLLTPKTTTQDKIKALRQEAAKLEFIDRLKSLGSRKDFIFKLTTSTSGTIISIDINGNPTKLSINDCLADFKNVLIKFFENQLFPEQNEDIVLSSSDIEVVSCNEPLI